MESPQDKIEELEKWRNMEKNVPSNLPIVKPYDIRLHTLASNECWLLMNVKNYLIGSKKGQGKALQE